MGTVKYYFMHVAQNLYCTLGFHILFMHQWLDWRPHIELAQHDLASLLNAYNFPILNRLQALKSTLFIQYTNTNRALMVVAELGSGIKQPTIVTYLESSYKSHPQQIGNCLVEGSMMFGRKTGAPVT